MANRLNLVHEADRSMSWARLHLGRELRTARIVAGATQREVGQRIGRSPSRISRLESGRVQRVALVELGRVAAAVGLRLHVSLHPGGRRPLDAAQLRLLSAFNARLHPTWRRRSEAPMPIPGDLRAVDEVITNGGLACAVEAITRLADMQAQVRSARAKQRDIGAQRLILLVLATRANRETLRLAGPSALEEFPMRTRRAMAALAAGIDPGGDCLILLSAPDSTP